jgi:restriction endonuclease S subunit
MRDGWIVTVLGELAEITTGSRAKGGAITSGIPSIGGEQIAEDRSIKFNKMKFIPKDHFESMRTGKLKFGDSLLVKDGATTGKVGYWGYDIPAAVNEHVFILRAKPDCAEPYFINLLISHRPFREEIESRSRGIIGGITRDIENIELVVPPLPEQKRIVDLISSVDSYIDALQQQLESAKRSRNAVLHELLTAGGDDWVERKLPEVVEVLDRMRKPINSTEREERKGNIPYYGANGQTGWIDEFIFNEELVLLGEDAIDFADPSARKAYLIQGPSWVNNHAHVLRADKTSVNPYFLMESLNKVDYSQYVSFGTRSKLTQASMNGIKVLVPSMKIQDQIVDLLTNFDEVIETTQKSIRDSKVLRSGMLSNLLSGEHEIPASYDKVIGAA